jgi:hypothetical protein
MVGDDHHLSHRRISPFLMAARLPGQAETLSPQNRDHLIRS